MLILGLFCYNEVLVCGERELDIDSRLTRSRKLVKFAKIAFFGVIGFFVFLLFVFPLLAFNLPSPDKIVRTQGFSTKILDRNGNILYDVYANQNRTPVVFLPMFQFILRKPQFPSRQKFLQKHQGFDPLGILRGFSRIFTPGKAEGGSTITQQLVKNVFFQMTGQSSEKLRNLFWQCK